MKLLALLLLSISALAQNPQVGLVGSTNKPLPAALDKDVALTIRNAQHALATTEGKLKDMQLQWVDLQTKMKDMQAQYAPLQQEDAAQKTAVDAAIDKAYKSAGKDKKGWDFDPDTLTFSAKAAPQEPKK